jgi:hypothetical protein
LDLCLTGQRDEDRGEHRQAAKRSDHGPGRRHLSNLQNLEPKLNRNISSRS